MHLYHAIMQKLSHQGQAFHWPSGTFFDHWPIRLLSLLPLFALNNIFSALCYLKTSFLIANQNGEIFPCILLMQNQEAVYKTH